MKDLITEDLKQNILKITLNNPSAQNTLSLDVINNLKQIITNADNDENIKVIIIASTGKIFSAGQNLNEINSHRDDNDKGLKFFTTLINSCSDLMLKIIHNSKPVIAEVNGVATAAGCQLVASCDLAYASNISKFATPGVNIGLFCSTPMVSLSRSVKNKHSMEMLLTGDLINCDISSKENLDSSIIIWFFASSSFLLYAFNLSAAFTLFSICKDDFSIHLFILLVAFLNSLAPIKLSSSFISTSVNVIP